MYQNIYYNRNTKIVHLWDDEQGYLEIPYEPYAYKKHPNGEYISLYGDKLKKIYGSEIENTPSELLFESDLYPEDRILIDYYKDNFDISKNHTVLFFDIETKTEGGVSKAADADQPIIAISYSANGGSKTCLLLNQTNTNLTKFEDGVDKVILFNHESELLLYFVDAWKKIKPTILTHWNGDNFDIPYIINRITKVLSINKAKALSPINRIDFNKREETYTIAGITSLDYMRLYKKFTYIGKPSYSLDAICKDEIGRGKIKFTGGFTELFKDQKKTVEYVNEDVQLLIDLDKKLKLIELTLFICHDAHTAYDNIYSNSRILDNASILYLNTNNIIAPNKKPKYTLSLFKNHIIGDDKIYVDKTIDRKKIPLQGVLKIKKSASSNVELPYVEFIDNYFVLEHPINRDDIKKGIIKKEWDLKIELPGAFVDLEDPGLYDLTSSIDLESLYPSIIITLNISPETKIGRILNWETDLDKLNEINFFKVEFVGGMEEKFSIENFEKFIEEKKVRISASGIMYDGTKKGFIPSILEKWFNHRVESKNLMKKYKKEGNDILTQLYFTKQLTEKVKLNSFYGVLALAVFRFFDLDNAESVTSTGQAIIKFSKKYIEKKYGDKTVIYLDTDSVEKNSILRTKEYGEISIQELFNKLNHISGINSFSTLGREIIKPDYLELPYFENNFLKWGEVEYIERHFTSKDMYEIETENGKKIIVTEDHSCMILDMDNNLIEKTPLDLKEGDKSITILPGEFKLFISKIKTKIKLGRYTDFVYDIGMKGGNHTFFANDILVHNSNYFLLQNIIKEQDIFKLTLDEIVEKSKFIDSEMNEKLILFSKLILRSDNNRLKFKLEKINKTALHIAKKRYALCTMYNEGFIYTEENTPEKDRIYDKQGNFIGTLAVTGLDIVRSDFPERFKEFMTGIVKKILAKFPKEDIDEYIIEFKNELHNEKIENILFPSGVSDIEKYKYGRSRFHVISGTPIHVKAALYYNDMLEYLNIDNLSPVGNWDKIKWCHLKENPLQLEVLAIKTNNENPKEIIDYILKYIDYEHMFESKLQNKLQDFYIAIKWGLLPDRNTKKINSLFKF